MVLLRRMKLCLHDFWGGLNKEIQTILEYKEYNNITRLFHLACKAEREVQNRQPRTRPNFSGGRVSSWTPRSSDSATRGAAPPTSKFSAPLSRVPSPTLPPPPSTGPSRSTSSVASTGKTKDVQCHRCWGYGHFERECTTKRAMIVREDGEYDSSSDYDEETKAFLSTQRDDDADSDIEVMGADAANAYPSLVAQRALSVQLSRAFSTSTPSGTTLHLIRWCLSPPTSNVGLKFSTTL